MKSRQSMSCRLRVWVGQTILLSLLAWVALTCLAGERERCAELAEPYAADREVRLWDRSRCDLVTATEAIEVDYAPKWAEAIGQAQWYAIVLDKRPAVLLLANESESDRRCAYRAQAVCARLGMRLYVEAAMENGAPNSAKPQEKPGVLPPPPP